MVAGAALVGGLYLAYEWWADSKRLPEGLIQANGRIEADDVTVASKFVGRVHQCVVAMFSEEEETAMPEEERLGIYGIRSSEVGPDSK